MRNENTVKVKIIRHGKTLLNEKRCYIGITDEPLSDAGREEVIKLRNNLVSDKTDIVFSSPMKRSLETAEILFPEARLITIDEFREMNFGSFEGKNYDELKDNPYYRKWIDESRGLPKEELDSIYKNLMPADEASVVLPEDNNEFRIRVLSGFKRIIAGTNGRDIMVIAHGGTIMALASLCSENDYYKYMVKNAEGIEATVVYTDNDGDIEISRVSINNRICS